MKSVTNSVLVCIFVAPQISNAAASPSSLSPSISENSKPQSSQVSVSKLASLAAQAFLPQVEAYLSVYYQALKSGQSAFKALENINNKVPYLAQGLIAQALYKKYESDILKLVFNRPIYKIEQPETTDFDYDTTGKYFLTVSNNVNTLRVWNTQDFWSSGKYMRIYSKTFDEILNPVTFGPDEKAYAWVGNHLMSIDIKTKTVSTFGQLADGIKYDEVEFIFLNGLKLYAGTIDHNDIHHSVKIVNIGTGETVKEIDYPDEAMQPSMLYYSINAQKFFIVQSDNSIRIIDPKTLEEKIVPPIGEEYIYISVIEASETKLYIGDSIGNVIIWDIEKNKLIKKQLDGEGNPATYIAIPKNTDSKLSLCVEEAPNIILYDFVSDKEFVLEGHQGAVNACEFTNDGNYLASISSDGTIKLWSTSQESLINIEPSEHGILKMKPITTITGHSPEFGKLKFQPQDPSTSFHIFTCGAAETIPTIRIWFLPTSTTFSFNEVIYLLALAKLLDKDFLKTFDNKKEYNNYIEGLRDPRLLKDFSLPERTNILEFLKTQQARKVAPAITLRSAEAP
ncbi:MAG: hypothetical protein WD055_03965 [Candidatus Dependentiae bacterium]